MRMAAAAAAVALGLGLTAGPGLAADSAQLQLAEDTLASRQRSTALARQRQALGVATETAVFKHLFARYYAQNVRFSYWRGKREHEVDLVAEMAGELIPFEVKYRSQHNGARELKGLIELCQAKRIARGYVVTKSLDDFGPMQGLPVSAAESVPGAPIAATQIMRIPAPLLCYWMGATETPAEARADEEQGAGGTAVRKN